MNKEQILYWLRKWHDDKTFIVDFEADNFDRVVDDLVMIKIENPFILFRILSLAVNGK